MNNKNKDGEIGYEKIGPTAWGVAYERTLSDIEYAKEIFDELNAVVKQDPMQLEYMEGAKISKFAPRLEARYKLTNLLLKKNKTGQILEIAAGLSPRGLAMTDSDPSLQYVEVDLPVMAVNKRKILDGLFSRHKAKPKNNLHIEDGDVLDIDSLLTATRHFKNTPISVVNEGLLRYLSFDEKAIAAKNIHSLLEKFGGVWITPDITRKVPPALGREETENRARVLALSGIDVDKNSFESEGAAIKFFEDLEFTVEKHSSFEVLDELKSPQKLGLSPKEVRDVLENGVAFVMRVK